MDTVDRTCAELQAVWHNEIPLAKFIGIEAASFANGELVVHAPFAPNVNLHGTAFAGSLFTVCVLAGWGRVWLGLRALEQSGLIVVADSRIEYRRAVRGDLVCRCSTVPDLESFAHSGRAETTLACTVDGAGAPAIRFEGRYVVLPHR